MRGCYTWRACLGPCLFYSKEASMRILPFVVLFLFACALPGCGGDSHESVSQGMVDLIDQAAGILEKVEDADSAEQAVEKIKALAAEAEDLKKRADALEDPGAERVQELKEKYAPLLSASMAKVGVQIDRIFEVAPEQLIPLRRAVKDLEGALKK